MSVTPLLFSRLGVRPFRGNGSEFFLLLISCLHCRATRLNAKGFTGLVRKECYSARIYQPSVRI